LVAALRIGVRLGHTPSDLCDRVSSLLERLGLPANLGAQPLADAANRLALDTKRRGGALRFVVAREVGDVTYIDLPIEALCDQVRALQ
jgi:3-dehydroquinate synthetase